MAFLTNSEEDIREMLAEIGVKEFSDLISNIPEDLKFKGKITCLNEGTKWTGKINGTKRGEYNREVFPPPPP